MPLMDLAKELIIHLSASLAYMLLGTHERLHISGARYGCLEQEGCIPWYWSLMPNSICLQSTYGTAQHLYHHD